jgi:hypothetical protein
MIATWSQSFTKLLAFNQTEYSVVLSLDSDATLLAHMDELFLLPRTPVAMPRAYWLPPTHPGGPHQLTSSVLLLEPSVREFVRIETAVSHAGERDFDMEILNQLYNKTALVLPHKPYFLVTGEFRNNETTGHEAYLGGGQEWDAKKVRKEAKYVHFSDWPMPKPWISAPGDFVVEKQPDCGVDGKGEGECGTREVWLELYRDFAARRKVRVEREGVGCGCDANCGIEGLQFGYAYSEERTRWKSWIRSEFQDRLSAGT